MGTIVGLLTKYTTFVVVVATVLVAAGATALAVSFTNLATTAPWQAVGMFFKGLANIGPSIQEGQRVMEGGVPAAPAAPQAPAPVDPADPTVTSPIQPAVLGS